MATNLKKNLKGVAGVHLVVAELSLRGFIALPTTRNLKSLDVVAFKQDFSSPVFLQVKSTDKPKSGWPVYTIPEDENWQERLRKSVSLRENFFYIFVALPYGDTGIPAFYVVPAHEAAEMLVQDWSKYLETHPKSKSKKQLLAWLACGHRGLDSERQQKYHNNWDLLSNTQYAG